MHPSSLSALVRGTTLLGLGLLIGACDVGVAGPYVGGDDDGAEVQPDATPAPTPDYSVVVSPTGTGGLGTTIDLTVDLTSSHFAGSVALTATGAPASWTVAIDPATITLADGGVGHATVHLTVPTNGDAAPTGTAITIAGAAAPGARTASSTVTVDNVYTLALGTPGTNGQHFGTMAGGQLRLKRGAKLRIPNTDMVAHRIHSDANVQGFPHQPASMAPGAMFEVTVSSTGSNPFYCHDHGVGTGQVRLTVE